MDLYLRYLFVMFIYSLYIIREIKVDGIPVLFIPGNAGSHKQGIFVYCKTI